MTRKLRSYLDLFPYTKAEERFCTRRGPTHHWILKSELGRAARRAIAKWFSVWISIGACLPLEGSNCLRGKEGFLLHQFCVTLETPLKKTALDKNLLLPGTLLNTVYYFVLKAIKGDFQKFYSTSQESQVLRGGVRNLPKIIRITKDFDIIHEAPKQVCPGILCNLSCEDFKETC